jgi:TPR repeat protein
MEASEKGLPEAQIALGERYLIGIDVLQDYSRAEQLLWRGVEGGFHTPDPGLTALVGNALLSLGTIYAEGRGNSVNLVEAYKCFNLSASLGNVEAKEERARVEEKMSTEEVVEAQRRSEVWATTQRRELQ